MPHERDYLVKTLEADMVGPYSLDPASEEVLPTAPLRWYMTGFLAPVQSPPIDPSTEDDDHGAGDDDSDPDTGGQEPLPKVPRRLPSSVGISVLLPPGTDDQHVDVMVRWGHYEPPAPDAEPRDKKHKSIPPGARESWTRRACGPFVATLRLEKHAVEEGVEVAPGVWVGGYLGLTKGNGLPSDTRALTVFVVNRGQVQEPIDRSCLFQVHMEVRFAEGLLPRPNRRDDASDDWDARVSDLQFRHRMEWAVGHGVSVAPIRADGSADAKVVGAQTSWLPSAEVPRVVTAELPDVVTEMHRLAQLQSGDEVRRALGSLVEAYGVWIATQRELSLDTESRKQTRDVLMHRAELARKRIAAGIDQVANDPQVLEAFRIANHAMALAAKQRSPALYATKQPAWRLFQLAFVLMNLPSIADPTHPDRQIVELIFFPTGGGKTEAYLGLVAFALALRRLRGAGEPHQGLGVTVLLRYTLRLLTLDQLGRAATLICALEVLRRQNPAKLGSERFSVGLWVGRTATPTTLKQASEAMTLFRSRRGPSPFPLPNCPWCGTELKPEAFPGVNNGEIPVGCLDLDHDCPFTFDSGPDGIPVLFVDEHIYRELPCFLVGTVDKFALLPWVGRTGSLFGRVTGRRGREFFGPMDGPKPPNDATRLPQGLPPPELIVQDELHLISGPLGTMVGLYETGIEQLCCAAQGEQTILPKIVASTATVRRAQQQVRSLFGRDQLAMFPPPGPDDSDTFFAKVDTQSPGRLYVGVAGASRAMKALLLRTYVALLCGAQKTFGPKKPDSQTADAYMTLVGYFNSLRELGGMRRLIEDEVRIRCQKNQRERMPTNATADHVWLSPRAIKYEPSELTSRESTAAVAEARLRLSYSHTHEDHIDVVLASNMISVGLDVGRLGLMVVAGQPKTSSEYIQASSRVGRSQDRPGLVVTVFNVFKPRDRSHYERFTAYHESFYRYVEATSVTPFSAPALDRGLAAVLVAMTRLGSLEMIPGKSVAQIEQARNQALAAVEWVAQKAANEHPDGATGAVAETIREEVRRRGIHLIDAWKKAVEAQGLDRYSPLLLDGGQGQSLLFTVLDKNKPAPESAWGQFCAPLSMRDVEPSVHLWKNRNALQKP
ncbi:MAG: DISARM system helicase DrmA [Polyangiaceae bacterium]|nr:DISARM system helicase DrmA [Polyangiaceae bacterium]